MTSVGYSKSEVYCTLSQLRILRLGYQRQSILSGGYFLTFSNENISNPNKNNKKSSSTDIA